METQSKYSVFLVDDDTMYLASLKNSLQQQFGSLLKIFEYKSGEECIEHVDETTDIVILDYYLNDGKNPVAMDGMKVLKEIKAISKDIVVIMISGQDKLQVALDSIKNGASDYIAKTESAFIIIQNTLKNAIESIKSARENNKFFKWNITLAIIIVAIILVDVIWYYSYHYVF
ncbi:MAG TPA: response regulator [Bacteroidia bacterium]|jgi:two-component system OmpR family response regulator|nr:response regulator [Bacteroidia bacterium]